jgi:hypothetical protein
MIKSSSELTYVGIINDFGLDWRRLRSEVPHLSRSPQRSSPFVYGARLIADFLRDG